jgi:hypothetical protein
MRWNKSEIATQSQDSILISISVGTISRDMLQFCMKPIEIKLSSSTFGLSEMSYFKDIIRLFLIAVYESMPSPLSPSHSHGLLYLEDGTLSLSRRVKACRVGQIHGEMF